MPYYDFGSEYVGTKFGDDGCHCETEAAHAWASRGSGNEKTYHLARTAAPWANEFRCARILDEPEIPQLTEFMHYPLVNHIAGFYLLDYVIFDLAPEFPVQRQAKQVYAPEVHYGMKAEFAQRGINTTAVTLRSLSAEAQAYKFTLAKEMAHHLREYLHYAIASELRYHSIVGQTLDATSTRRMYWGWQKLIGEFGGEQVALWAAELYRDRQVNGRPGWDAYYGGESWAQICDVLAMYERGFVTDHERGPRRHHNEWWHPGYRRGEFSAFEFVDRVASLQHNTGSCLTKASWSHGLEAINFVLNCHHNSHTRGLYDHAMPVVQSIVSRYWDLKNKLNDNLSNAPIKIPMLRNCEKCLPHRLRTEDKLNDKPVALCRGHHSDMCKSFGCMNDRPYGNDVCSWCSVKHFHGVSEDKLKVTELDLHGYVSSASTSLMLQICMGTERGIDCDCKRPNIYIKDGIVYIDEPWHPLESEDSDGKNVV